jgi:hypothetical protein
VTSRAHAYPDHPSDAEVVQPPQENVGADGACVEDLEQEDLGVCGKRQVDSDNIVIPIYSLPTDLAGFRIEIGTQFRFLEEM